MDYKAAFAKQGCFFKYNIGAFLAKMKGKIVNFCNFTTKCVSLLKRYAFLLNKGAKTMCSPNNHGHWADTPVSPYNFDNR